jgi:bifunctional non-homologous end joining protein LigD
LTFFPFPFYPFLCGAGGITKFIDDHFLKLSTRRFNPVIIGGYTPGNPFDALIVGYYEGDKLLYTAKVRNGFVPQVRREVASRFKGLRIDAYPFANLPERKRTQWL